VNQRPALRLAVLSEGEWMLPSGFEDRRSIHRAKSLVGSVQMRPR